MPASSIRVVLLRTLRAVARRLALAFSVFTIACADASTEPVVLPGAQLVIAPLPDELFELDVVTLRAVLRDSAGGEVAGAPVTWSVSDPRIAEVDGGVLTALKPGVVRLTARAGAGSASVQATRELHITRLAVQQVGILLPLELLAQGDVMHVGVRVLGQGGRTVIGRVVQLTSDDPSVAVVDPSGRVRAVNPGTTMIRATADGVSGATRIEVAPRAAQLALRDADGSRLPMLVASDTVSWNGVKEYHEIWLESGTLRLTGTTQPRYEVDLRYAEYDVRMTDGRRTLTLRTLQRMFDRGVIAFDSRGDFLLTSEYISPLSHTAIPTGTGMQLRFRVPGDDQVLLLNYRREPE